MLRCIIIILSDVLLGEGYTVHKPQGSPVNCGLYLCCRRWYNGTVSGAWIMAESMSVLYVIDSTLCRARLDIMAPTTAICQ
jgi:hypothetical protein